MSVTAIAKTVIHRTIKPGLPGDKSKGVAPVKPVVEIIPAGNLFVCETEEEFKELHALGAAERRGNAAKAAAVSPKAKTAPKGKTKDDAKDDGKTTDGNQAGGDDQSGDDDQSGEDDTKNLV